MTIYKYVLPMTDRVTIPMPFGAQVLCVQIWDGEPCLWTLVDSGAPLAARHFRIARNGQLFDESAYTYIGTFQLPRQDEASNIFDRGALVFHVFEVPAEGARVMPWMASERRPAQAEKGIA